MDVKGFILFFIAVPLIVGGCSRTEPGNPEVPDYPQSYYVNGSFDAPLSVSERGGLKSFEYYGSGMAIEDIFQYKFTKEDEGVRFEYDFYIQGEEAEGEVMLDPSYIDELVRLSDKYDLILKWDGFDKSAEGVLDGSGFSLSMGFEDGSSISARGENEFPDGYRYFNEDFKAIIDKIAEEQGIFDKLFPKVIESEDLSFISIDFNTRGAEKFEFMLRPDAPNENIDTCKIRSQEDEKKLFGGETENHFSKKAGYSLEPVQAVLKKYNIASWNGYDGYDEGSDIWFSIFAEYESGERITASGSLAPENYEEFKDEIINVFADFYQKNKGGFYQ